MDDSLGQKESPVALVVDDDRGLGCWQAPCSWNQVLWSSRLRTESKPLRPLSAANPVLCCWT